MSNGYINIFFHRHPGGSAKAEGEQIGMYQLYMVIFHSYVKFREGSL